MLGDASIFDDLVLTESSLFEKISIISEKLNLILRDAYIFDDLVLTELACLRRYLLERILRH